MPAHNDPFAALGLPRTLDLSSDQIQRAYLVRMAAAHPDAGSDAVPDADPPTEHDASLEAARLNDARRTLAHPERRAIALYTLLSLDAGRSPDSKIDAALPAGFLMEIMSIREQIESAVAAQSLPQIESWREWAIGQRSAYLNAVGELLAGRDFANARQQLNAWRYIERLIEQLDPAYDPNRVDFAG